MSIAIQITEANHDDDAFWTLAVGEYESREELDREFDAIPGTEIDPESKADYSLDKLIDGDIVEEKFVSAETVERITGRKIGRMRAGAKNSLRAEIARFDKRKMVTA